MTVLSSNSVLTLGDVDDAQPSVRRISEGSGNAHDIQSKEFLLVRHTSKQIQSGYAGYLFFEKPKGDVPRNSFLLPSDLSYLCQGDIIRITPGRNHVRTLYRKQSRHNFLLLTEQCNNFCLMCSQPPKKVDDSYLVEEILQMIPLMSKETSAIGITGGEPALLGQKLIEIVESLKHNLPSTPVLVLSNGRYFKSWDFAKLIADVKHPELMIGIPLYSDISSLHDYVVQADGAYDDTIRGIINLKSVGVKVEIRVVLHKLTFERLPDLARFIRRNLTFCDHVALMGLEMTGFTKINIDALWIDPKHYQPQLREAVELLSRARISVSIYNHQLCILDPSLESFNRKSISDWKNEYMSECEGCGRKADCGGFFSSAKLKYSAYITPFRTEASNPEVHGTSLASP